MTTKPFHCDYCGGDYGELEFCCHKRLEYIAWHMPDVTVLRNSERDLKIELSEAQRRLAIFKGAISDAKFLLSEALTQTSIMNQSVVDLELTVRTTNVLISNNIKTVGDLVALSERQLTSFNHLGRRSITEIRETLAQYRLALRV